MVNGRSRGEQRAHNLRMTKVRCVKAPTSAELTHLTHSIAQSLLRILRPRL